MPVEHHDGDPRSWSCHICRGAYDQKDAAGFIKLNALRLRTLGLRDKKR